MAHAVGAAIDQRPKDQPDTTPIVGREAEVELLRLAVDQARMRQLQVIELVGEPGIGKSRLVQELRTLALGFQQLETAAEHYSSAEPYAAFRALLRQLVGITPDRTREEAGAQLAPFVTGMMPDLAPWLPLLAIPFDAEVPVTAEATALDPAASRDRLHTTVETFLERILMMPTLIVVEDAHWLDDGSRFLLSHLVAKPALRPWLVCVTTRPGAEPLVRADGTGRQDRARAADRQRRGAARDRGRRAMGAVDRRGTHTGRALGRQSVLRARARVRGAARRDAGEPAGDGREPAHDAHRHARSRRPDAAPVCGGAGPDLRARPARRDPRGRDPRGGPPRTLGVPRRVRRTGRARPAHVPSRPRAGHRLRGALVPSAPRHPRPGRGRDREAAGDAGRGRGCAAVAPLLRGGRPPPRLAVLRDRRPIGQRPASRTSLPPSCTTARSQPRPSSTISRPPTWCV